MITAAPQNDLSLVYYRALFDYDPTTMSPNPNHHDEIKFKEMLLPDMRPRPSLVKGDLYARFRGKARFKAT